MYIYSIYVCLHVYKHHFYPTHLNDKSACAILYFWCSQFLMMNHLYIHVTKYVYIVKIKPMNEKSISICFLSTRDPRLVVGQFALNRLSYLLNRRGIQCLALDTFLFVSPRSWEVRSLVMATLFCIPMSQERT